MRFSLISLLLSAAGLTVAAPTPTPATSSDTALQTFTAPASLMPAEIADLINSGQSMLVTTDSGLLGTGLLSSSSVLFGQFNDDGTSTVDSSYLVPFSLLPPQLVTSLEKSVELLISEGPTDLIQIITGVLTFTPSVSKRDVEVKRQAPLSGPIGNFLAQLIGALPVEALPSL